jgi:O-methyltransferase
MSRRLVSAARRRLRRRPAQAPEWVDPNLPDATTTPEDEAIMARARPYTITSAARMQSLIDSVRYCERRGIPGAFAECGVWLGGSVLVMVLTLQALGREDRDIYLYDTFEGMTEPGEDDVSPFDPPALETWRAAQQQGAVAWPEYFDPAKFHEQAVRETLLATGYPAERLHFVRGTVEETLPARAPERLALLRLDTDWYDSTLHELRHLYPRLETGGVLIVDDYGHWEGARRAVDEYFATAAAPVLLNRVDYTARTAVKL